jgi:AcrR family transcriptional regulator
LGHYPLYRQLRPGPGKGREEVAANQRSRLCAATIELVAEQGYDGMTVSGVTRLAGVSKASFYEQFSDKEDCFLATCDTALREAASAVLRGESAARGGRERLRAGLTALVDLLEEQPKGASLVLIDSLAATPAIRRHVSRRLGLLERLLRERLATAGQGNLSRTLTTGIVRGIEHHARRFVRCGRPDSLRDLVDPLLDWGLEFNCEEASTAFSETGPPICDARRPAYDQSKVAGAHTRDGSRGLLVEAALHLAARDGYDALTPSNIRRTAGVSRRTFEANFEDATSCFLTAVGTELEKLFAEALRAAPVEADWGERTCHVLDLFTASLAAEPDLARLAFVEALGSGSASILWRERLIADWAEALYRGAPVDRRPTPAIAESTVAAIWGYLGDLLGAQDSACSPSRRSWVPAPRPRRSRRRAVGRHRVMNGFGRVLELSNATVKDGRAGWH